jgi:glutaredoxin-like protein NrdH
MPSARSPNKPGAKPLKVMLYALSTCGWCKKTRQFLDDNDVEYDFVYVDLLQGEEKEQVLAKVRQWNPRASFPTIVVDDAECVVGFKEDRLREVLQL